MATLSTTQQAQIQEAIDLMVKGTAVEIPFADDVLTRLRPLQLSLGFTGTGFDLDTLVRDMPIVVLIVLVYICGFSVLSSEELAKLLDGAYLMYKGSARNIPFAEDVIQRIAPVAASSGFMTVGGFYEEVKNRPISTMLRFALFLGRQ